MLTDMTEAEVRHRLADLDLRRRHSGEQPQSKTKPKAGGRSDVHLPIPVGPVPAEVGLVMAGSPKKGNVELPSLRKNEGVHPIRTSQELASQIAVRHTTKGV
jgi:hypothetical protein